MNSCAHSSQAPSRRWPLLLFVLVTSCVVSLSGCDKLRARDQLNKGVAAYKAGQFDSAIEFFKKAEEYDPGLLNARIYLATSYASLYIPGAPSDENTRKGERAVEEFKEVLKTDPNNLSAIDGIGSLYYNMAANPFSPDKFEEAKKYELQHIQLKPTDPEPYYWIGVINWTLAYRANAEMRSAYNKEHPTKQVHDDQPLPPNLRQDYATKYGPMTDEGINDLNKAIELRPDYDDAMAYLELLYHRKADMVESPQDRDDLLHKADVLLDRVKQIKQQKAENPQQPKK